ncbi:MAG: aldehyde dehydrogenase (NADP(+)) [Proteobacteria bacterium]|nr:aldehyde dehydrogenase (NADP(+)) [Pseudomonadota bacterium]
MTLHGKNFIGRTLVATSGKTSTAINPATGATLEGGFVAPTKEEVNQAVEHSQSAFGIYSKVSQLKRAEFLDAVGDEIMALGDELIKRAVDETALPETRITGERGRTIGQLKAFANLLREGSWLEATIDLADPDRAPVPKVDIRRMLVPIGPVVVFAASNFPLAFSTAGGDTASALAGGNPVIMKAHSGHPGTSELVAGAIIAAAQKTEMPDGVFSLLHGSGRTVGQALVKHPLVKAVGFTGSAYAGRTLFNIANERPEPIPVFAEMGSINPVLVTPKALNSRGDSIASDYAGSITLGTGQFCTNPGLILGIDNGDLDDFVTLLGKAIEEIAPSTMLNPVVFSGFSKSYENILAQPDISVAGKSTAAADTEKLQAPPTVVVVDGKTFLANQELHQEVFGPFSLVVKCSDAEELLQVASSLEGQLTASVIAEESDFSEYSAVIDTLQGRVGRILYNGVPTGVEVCASMQHGGPYPAATDSRFTSVGTAAIKRFVRPVAFQNWPDKALPAELLDSNPLGIWRLVDNTWTKNKIDP